MAHSARPAAHRARYLLALCVVALIAWAPRQHAAQNPEPLEIQHGWEKGQTHRFLTTKTRTNRRPGVPAMSVTAKWDNTLEVIHADDQHIILAWTRGEMTFHPELPLPPSMRALVNIWADARIELKFDAATLEFAEIHNFEQVKERIDDTMAGTRKMMLEMGRDEKTVDRTIKTTRQMFDDPKSCGQLLMKDIGGLISGYGRELFRDADTEYEIELPTPLSEKPLPATEVWEKPVPGPAPNSWILKWTQTYDEEALGKILTEFMGKLADQDPQSRRAAEAAAKAMLLNLSGTQQYDEHRKLITHATMQLSAVNDEEGAGRVETWEWQMLPAKEPGEGGGE